ncbi:MAG: hypothetical protein JSW72_03090 [Candidatus Bathyarchaeota archaeon]|nr:MAG: hypothetical protein JSW72_03090 [Candidatus Bathyarchaeota archaeon]
MSVMFQGKKLKKIDKSELPLFYRLILRIPLPSLDSLPDAFQGFFWVIVAPVSVVTAFFLSALLLTTLPSPFNVAAVALVPSIFVLVFVRLSLERFIRGWDALIDTSTTEKDVEKLMNEYLEMLKDQEHTQEKTSSS